MTTGNLLVGVNTVSQPDSMTDLEKKHVPVITCPPTITAGEYFDVTVEVGKMLAHPNERGHFIEFIDLYADETFLARLDLTPVNAAPTATFRIALNDPVEEIRSYACCNLHGTWLASQTVIVR